MDYAALAQMGMQFGMGLYAQGQANKKKDDITTAQNNLNDIIDNRQEIVNPYANVKAYQATDLSDTFTNPYANLRVATKAAEMQMEETDKALANTLDTLRQSGMGAGGATALAQAASKSKQGIAAGIEAQEVNNEKLRAQGESTLQQRIASEKARVQGIEQSESARVQSAEAAGQQFMYQAQEARTMADLNRYQALLDNESAQQMAYQEQAFGAFGEGVGYLTPPTAQGDEVTNVYNTSSGCPQGKTWDYILNMCV